MDIEKAKAEYSAGRFRGPKYVRLLLEEVEKLQNRVKELEQTQPDSRPVDPYYDSYPNHLPRLYKEPEEGK